MRASGSILRLRGAVAVRDAQGHVQPLSAGRGTELLVLLAVEGDWVSRDRLGAVFWPDHAATEARRNLRKVLHRLEVPAGLPPLQARESALRWPVPTDLDEPGRAPIAQGLELRAGEGYAAWLREARSRHAGSSETGAESAGSDDEEGAFVGRRVELQTLQRRLAPGSSTWLTLVGVGGVGKSRLALEVARRLAGRWSGAVVRVPFAGVGDAGTAVLQLAQAVAPGAAGPALARVQSTLRERPWLLVLDELDRLAPWARAVRRALPGTCVLATSRTRLGVAQEEVIALEGLPWPDADDDLSRAADFDAVQLFEQAARRAWSDYDAGAERAAAAALCAAVHGHPLALRVAAGFVRHQGVADLVALARRGRLGAIEPLLEASWQQLSPAAREALARVSVCRGSFDAAAAQAISAVPLGVLDELVDHSMLSARRRRQGSRYELHPLVQRYAQGRLGDAAGAEGAHTAHFLGLLAAMPPPARAAERPAWLAAVEQDAGNVEAAWRTAVRDAAGDRLGEAAVGWASWCHARADWSGGLAGLAVAEPLVRDPVARARLQCAQALLAVNAGDAALAVRQARAALRVLRRHDDRPLLRSCLFYLGSALLHLESHAAAERCLREMLEAARVDGDQRSTAHALQALAQAAAETGRPARALALIEQAMAATPSPTPAFMVAELARLLTEQGRAAEADERADEALRAMAPGEPSLHRSLLHGRRAEALLALGRHDEAREQLAQAEAAHAEGRLPAWGVTLHLVGAELAATSAAARRRLAAARAALAAAPTPALRRQVEALAARLDGTGLERPPR